MAAWPGRDALSSFRLGFRGGIQCGRRKRKAPREKQGERCCSVPRRTVTVRPNLLDCLGCGLPRVYAKVERGEKERYSQRAFTIKHRVHTQIIVDATIMSLPCSHHHEMLRTRTSVLVRQRPASISKRTHSLAAVANGVHHTSPGDCSRSRSFNACWRRWGSQTFGSLLLRRQIPNSAVVEYCRCGGDATGSRLGIKLDRVTSKEEKKKKKEARSVEPGEISPGLARPSPPP